MSKFSLCLFLLGLSLITSKTITTNDLASALSQAVPGDTIELKSGTYSSVPYSLKSGTAGKPITIKAAANANIVFTGTSTSYIFSAHASQYVNIEGPF